MCWTRPEFATTSFPGSTPLQSGVDPGNEVEVASLGADQKERGFWGREWTAGQSERRRWVRGGCALVDALVSMSDVHGMCFGKHKFLTKTAYVSVSLFSVSNDVHSLEFCFLPDV